MSPEGVPAPHKQDRGGSGTTLWGQSPCLQGHGASGPAEQKGLGDGGHASHLEPNTVPALTDGHHGGLRGSRRWHGPRSRGTWGLPPGEPGGAHANSQEPARCPAPEPHSICPSPSPQRVPKCPWPCLPGQPQTQAPLPVQESGHLGWPSPALPGGAVAVGLPQGTCRRLGPSDTGVAPLCL